MSNNLNAFDLESLRGLENAKRLIRKMWHQDSGVHAVLLYGVEGSGKSHLARILASGWMCRNEIVDGPCGSCPSCIGMADGLNPDMFTYAPRGSSEAILLGMITEREPVEDVIPLQTFLRTMPLGSRRKIALVESADRMTDSAANALLKTLEEPPEYAKIILTTRSLHKVLPTIISRCTTLMCDIPQDGQRRPYSVGERIRREEFAGHIRSLEDIADRIAAEGVEVALAQAEVLRGIAERYRAETDLPARKAQGQILEWLAEAFAERNMPHHVAAVSEAHRRVLQNGSFGLGVDALMVQAHLNSARF